MDEAVSSETSPADSATATPSRGTPWLLAAGRSARWVGSAAASLWRLMDPDIPRHLVQLPLLGLTMLAPRRPPVAPLPEDGFRPVIFIHGLGGHRGNFLPARLFLRLYGRTRTYAVGFKPEGDPDGLAAELRRFVHDVCEVNGLGPDAQVDLVGHSLGGLLARLAIEDDATRVRVATIVTMGTPHGGTHAARFAYTAMLRALRPDSELLRRLASQVPWRGSPRLVTFWSDSDLLLLPSSAGRVEGAENVELPGVTHYGYLLQPACFRRLAQALSASFQSAEPADDPVPSVI